MISEDQPGPVVRGEHDQGVSFEAVGGQRFQDLADGFVDFLDDVSVEAPLAPAGECVAREKRRVRHVVRDIEEKGPVPLSMYEVDRAFGIASGEQALVRVDFDDVISLQETNSGLAEAALFERRASGAHVVGALRAKEFVEAVLEGEGGMVMAQMPLAKDCGGVAPFAQNFGQQFFIGVDAVGCIGADDGGDADALRITTGEQRGARRGADRRRDVEIGEAHSLARQPVEMGRLKAFGSLSADVGVSLVVGEDDDNVGRSVPGRSRGAFGAVRAGDGEGHDDPGKAEADLFRGFHNRHKHAERFVFAAREYRIGTILDKNAARNIIWIRSIDRHDAEGLILSPEVRARAAETPADAELEPGERQARQAGKLVEAIAAEHPEMTELDARFHWPWWLSPGILAAVFVAGVIADTLTSSGRIDIIAFPLLGLFLWNLAIYAFLAGRRFIAWKKKRTVDRLSPLSAWFPQKLFKILPWPDFPAEEGKKNPGEIWRAAAGSFAPSWLKIERPMFQERLRILFHGAAVAAVAGMALNMYLKGLNFEYRAGWSSTFFQEDESLRSWLGFVFGPASWLTGIALPDAAGLKAVNWSVNPKGENAADWIHLYAATALLVMSPRLVLMGLSALRGWRAGREVQLEGLDAPLLSKIETTLVATESLERICIVPYNHTCAPVFRDRFRKELFDRSSERFQLDYLDRVNYGLEAEYAAGLDVDQLRCKSLLVVFNLSSTPEEEVQGMFLDRLHQMTRRSQRHVGIEVWLDESSFSERFRADAGFADRLGQRRASWTRLLAKREMKPEFIDIVTEEYLRLAARPEDAQELPSKSPEQ